MKSPWGPIAEKKPLRLSALFRSLRLRCWGEESTRRAPSCETEHAEWALSRFETAGLELPPLTIVFHYDYESCGMREGVLRITGEDLVVHECEQDPARSRRSLLHELTHAWDRAGSQLNDRSRIEFLRLRSLASWTSDGLPWNQRGEEQGAEIMAWGLMHRPTPIPTSVGQFGPQDPADLEAAFTLLTGIPPLFDELQISAHAGSRTARPGSAEPGGHR